MKVRIDKWLQVARAFKTRSQATKACTAGRVRVNGSVTKPHRLVSIDDRIEIDYRGGRLRVLIVRELHDRPLPKKEVPRIFEDQSPPSPKLSELDVLVRQAKPVRSKGAGRPTKKDRRKLERLRG